jgi:glycosyltransferase involved in cell wall biosynthesis
LIEKLPASILVVHKGLVEPAQVIPTLAQHDLFLLPTRGENFGHVIHEALRAGLPVLISDQTPWRGLAPLRVGWDLSLGDESGFVKRIEEAAAWTESERQRCSARARAYAATAAEDPANLEANRRLFLDVIHDSAVGIQPAPHSKVRNVQE